MLLNPFTPSEIASSPADFFGRSDELRTLERSLRLGSVAIQGAIGIGKSSLLARVRLLMEGFDTDHRARSVVAVADKHVRNIDEAARLLLECFVEFDERQDTARFKLGSFVEIESGEVTRLFAEGRHLAALKRILQAEYLQMILQDGEMLVLAVDEADKSPVPLAQLARSIFTHTQQEGVKNVRFVLAGVNPYLQEMVSEDPGISRFFYRTISLEPMRPEDAADLVETKLGEVSTQAASDGFEVSVEPSVVARVVALSGGHPHLLQLLGSHLVEHEEEDPDGIIDSRDLANALRRICFEDRARVYHATLHLLELHNRREDLQKLLALAPQGFPTLISKRQAIDEVGEGALQWFADRNVITVRPGEDYGLVDEFLRVRILLDHADSPTERASLETQLIRSAASASDMSSTDPFDAENELIDRIENKDEEDDI